MKKILILALLLTSGCVSTKSSDIFLDKPITSPKVLAVQGTRAPWVYEIEKRLRKQGFKIKRMASQGTAIEDVSPTKTKAYREATAQYILLVDGYARNDSMNRCFGGGYNFDYIDIEMIDVRNNESVLHYSNSGFSEGCQPMSGTIFTDIENLINSAWK